MTERRVGAELPRDYKEFLVRHNGGSPDRSYLAVGRFGLVIPD